MQARLVRNYFVDEAGDGTLFSGKGKVIVSTPGCSRFFILGMADVSDPDALGRDLEDLRARLLADPYFKGVPSIQPEERKTALACRQRTIFFGRCNASANNARSDS